MAETLSNANEHLPFPDIDPKAYEEYRASDEAAPGYRTPIDELLARFRAQGCKVVLGKHPGSGNVFVLPADSNDIENDSLFPRELQSTSANDNLNQLIETGKLLFPSV
jgi:acetaldehyde dehydrogenase (acetylating)